jgi:transposase
MLSRKEEKRAYVLNGVLAKRWTAGEGAELLQLSERHLWRILGAYRQEGVAALVHGNRGRKPINATPDEVKQEMVQLAQGPYDGANYSHLAELWAEREGLQRSRWTVRRVLRAAGVGSSKRRRRMRHRSRRERYPQEGMLLQVDGSRHQWLGADGPWLTLIGGIDDATGTVPYAVFREEEDGQGYLLLVQGVIETKGIPLALYSDHHSIFIQTVKETLEEQLLGRREPTQVGRALEELGIRWIPASSPQAKGRVERLWQTLQDRLCIELRLAGAKTLDEANRVLWSYLPKFNARFGVPAGAPGSAYQPGAGLDLGSILCFKYRRTVASDNTVQFGGKTLQVQPTPHRSSYARARVEIQERLDGSIAVAYQGTVLAITEAAPQAITLRARTGPRLSAATSFTRPVGRVSPPPDACGAQGHGQAGKGLDAGSRPDSIGAKTPPKPGPHHPWKRQLIGKQLLTKSLHHTTDGFSAP